MWKSQNEKGKFVHFGTLETILKILTKNLEEWKLIRKNGDDLENDTFVLCENIGKNSTYFKSYRHLMLIASRVSGYAQLTITTNSYPLSFLVKFVFSLFILTPCYVAYSMFASTPCFQYVLWGSNSPISLSYVCVLEISTVSFWF